MTAPPQAACVLILRPSDGKVLAVSRKHDETQFGLPGGKVDPGETPREAAIREALEETGLDVRLLQPVYAGVCVGEIPHYTWTYLAAILGQKQLPDEEGKVAWVSWSRLFEGPFQEYNLRVYEIAKRRGFLKMRKSGGNGIL